MFRPDGAVLRQGTLPWQRGVRAFSWIDAGNTFRRGVCPPGVLETLEAAARRPVNRTRGFHTCPLCPRPEPDAGSAWSSDSHPTPYSTGSGEDLQLGSASLEITAGRQTWEAPDLVLHYVVEHEYLPPDELIQDFPVPDRRVVPERRATPCLSWNAWSAS